MMEKQTENETKNIPSSSDPADRLLNPEELEQVSGGDEAPKETVTFEYGGFVIRYGNG